MDLLPLKPQHPVQFGFSLIENPEVPGLLAVAGVDFMWLIDRGDSLKKLKHQVFASLQLRVKDLLVIQPAAVFVKILQKNWLGVFLSLKNLSRGFAPTLRYPRIFF